MNSAGLPTGDPELVALVRRMAGDLVTPGGATFDRELWEALTGAEVHLVGLPIGAGGAGGSLADLVAAVVECARTGAAIPLVENFLAQWLRAQAGGKVGSGVALCAQALASEGDSVLLGGLTWAQHADEIVVVDRATARAVGTWTAAGSAGAVDLAGQPTQDVTLSTMVLEEAEVLTVDPTALRAITDVLRSAQLAGAIRGCYELSRRYAAERQQFGVRIDSFPAVQHHLVQLAQAAAMTRVAAFRATAALDSGAFGTHTARSARLVCDRFARDAIRCAHQVHGAIGMTREYPLASLTRRLHWWRLVDRSSVAGPVAADFLHGMWMDAMEERSR